MTHPMFAEDYLDFDEDEARAELESSRPEPAQLITGMRVPIFSKPITSEDFEGWAMLCVKVRQDEGDGLSMWIVEFDNRPGHYLRTINAYA